MDTDAVSIALIHAISTNIEQTSSPSSSIGAGFGVGDGIFPHNLNLANLTTVYNHPFVDARREK